MNALLAVLGALALALAVLAALVVAIVLGIATFAWRAGISHEDTDVLDPREGWDRVQRDARDKADAWRNN